jgi:hypothetical protein
MCAQEWIWLVNPAQSARDSQKLADAKFDVRLAAKSGSKQTRKLLPLSSRKPCLVID